MNRTLTAGVALAAALGTAGLALAQGNMSPTQSPTTTATPTTPNATGSPASSGNYQQPGSLGQQGQQVTSPASIQQAQQQLRTQGLYNGAIDGQTGPEMRSALLQFQQRNGLPQTGMLDQQTQARLMQSSSNGMNPTPTSGSSMQGSGTTQTPAAPLTTNR